MTVEIRIRSGLDALGIEAARAIADRVATRVSRTGAFAVSLAGGRTPIALYAQLAERYRDAVPWERVHFFWSDERYVPPDDPASNYGLFRTEFLSRVPVPRANVHPMPTGLPEFGDAAAAYESSLRESHGPGGPLFDLAILGLGVDGHTASLFPGSPVLHEIRRWVVPVLAPVPPARRLTLTLPALNLAREVFFLVAGAEKAPALANALRAEASPEDCPAAGVRPAGGRTIWWVDDAAAARLRMPPGRVDPSAK